MYYIHFSYVNHLTTSPKMHGTKNIYETRQVDPMLHSSFFFFFFPLSLLSLSLRRPSPFSLRSARSNAICTRVSFKGDNKRSCNARARSLTTIRSLQKLGSIKSARKRSGRQKDTSPDPAGTSSRRYVSFSLRSIKLSAPSPRCKFFNDGRVMALTFSL